MAAKRWERQCPNSGAPTVHTACRLCSQAMLMSVFLAQARSPRLQNSSGALAAATAQILLTRMAL